MEILIQNSNNNFYYDDNNYKIILNKDDEYNIVMHAINNTDSEKKHLRLYRSLNFMEEKEAFEYIKNQESQIILYTSRSNHRYYFVKIKDKVLQIITNNNYDLYTIRNMNNEFYGFMDL
jgi:ribosomal protein S18 acetylase RimI-like enzyme